MIINRIKLHLLTVLAIGLSQAAMAADLPISRTAGMLATTVPGNAVTHVGLPFTKEPVARKVITAAAGSTITVAASSFTAGAFILTPHSAQIIGGPNDGLVLKITANSTNTLTISGTVPAGIRVNVEQVLVVPDWTLATLFGAPAVGLTGAATAAAADKVSVEDDGVVTQYFYNTTASQWRNATNVAIVTDAANVRVLNLRGVVVTRIAGSAFDIVQQGVVRSGTQRASLLPAKTSILTVPFASNLTLASSGLSDAVTGGPNAAVSDKVKVEAAGVVTSYFYKTASGSDPTTGWRLASGVAGSQDGVVLAAGKSVVVERLTANNSIRDWRSGVARRLLSTPPPASAKTWKLAETFAQ